MNVNTCRLPCACWRDLLWAAKGELKLLDHFRKTAKQIQQAKRYPTCYAGPQTPADVEGNGVDGGQQHQYLVLE